MRTLAMLWNVALTIVQLWVGALLAMAGDVVMTVISGVAWVAC